MANLKIPDRIRLQLEAAESPTFAGAQPGLGLSPVTDLAFNLSGTSLGSTPRRRLSLSSIDNTPTPNKTKNIQDDLSDPDSSVTGTDNR
ncbi:hypothetical protein L9F63_012414 [Diploptera punctata]|uniref:Uncharacterized protein n=1 Tax=Diploptera punctata TaxID=6984 RepID=A0AAD8ADH3_DIPPU|nr:hypothetical protein L9F63_012414 [Diploptera punctata]